MEFIVSDRESVEQGTLVRSEFIVISIRDPEKPKARIPKQSSLRGVLYLAFDDAEPTPNRKLPEFIKPMTPAQAQKVIRFFEKYEAKVGAVVVHCEAGMSRSPAVAAGLCKRSGGDDSEFFKFYMPNRYVYRLVLRAGK